MKRAPNALTNSKPLKHAHSHTALTPLAPLFPLLEAGAGCGDAYNGIASQIISHLPKPYQCILRMVNKQASQLVPVPFGKGNSRRDTSEEWDDYMSILIADNHLSCIKYCHRVFGVYLNHWAWDAEPHGTFCQTAAQYGHIDILEWGLEHENTEDLQYAFEAAVWNNQYAVIDYFMRRRLEISDIENLYMVAMAGSETAKMFEFLYVKHGLRVDGFSVWTHVYRTNYEPNNFIGTARWCRLHSSETMFSLEHFFKTAKSDYIIRAATAFCEIAKKASYSDDRLVYSIMTNDKYINHIRDVLVKANKVDWLRETQQEIHDWYFKWSIRK